VADDASRAPGPFDVQTIKHLVALMSRHDLSEIDLREGEVRLRIRRGARQKIVTASTVAAPAPAPTAPPPSVAAAPAAAAEPARPGKALLEIKAQGPGIFYSAPKPGEEPFVRVGSRVEPATVVGIIEAMKLFDNVLAGCTGVIAEVLVENQQAVDYGQVLFRVDPSA
jgi:acetyl-CoA carboxylase biotin carboxyl carrier protein